MRVIMRVGRAVREWNVNFWKILQHLLLTHSFLRLCSTITFARCIRVEKNRIKVIIESNVNTLGFAGFSKFALFLISQSVDVFIFATSGLINENLKASKRARTSQMSKVARSEYQKSSFLKFSQRLKSLKILDCFKRGRRAFGFLFSSQLCVRVIMGRKLQNWTSKWKGWNWLLNVAL